MELNSTFLFLPYIRLVLKRSTSKKNLRKLEKAIRDIAPSSKTELLQVFDKIRDNEI
ncbi:hypothetical protein HMPREF0322_03274 [Desulfitobacterium hafniense DP7]|uniref:Uncharacterized protein n=1 Tax=Desulfitobacterium hafniense DP7 TaxID=537010 RepID=G9XQM6_DESHA|nr:hypothetical protein HMPREF0322_03274 [Desulfitobacterium hafniense DP7]